MVENAKPKKFKCDISSNFQTMCTDINFLNVRRTPSVKFNDFYARRERELSLCGKANLKGSKKSIKCKSTFSRVLDPFFSSRNPMTFWAVPRMKGYDDLIIHHFQKLGLILR